MVCGLLVALEIGTISRLSGTSDKGTSPARDAERDPDDADHQEHSREQVQ
jgi:hypothetical protein